MAGLLNSCDDCAQLSLTECEDIEINAGLDPDTDYYWTLTDNFGNKWSHTDTTDGDGTLTLLSSYFPDGFLTTGIGQVSLEIKTSATGDVVQVTFDGYVSYDCLQITFQKNQPIGSTVCCYDAASMPEITTGMFISYTVGGVVIFPSTGQHLMVPEDALADQMTGLKNYIQSILGGTWDVSGTSVCITNPADASYDDIHIYDSYNPDTQVFGNLVFTLSYSCG